MALQQQQANSNRENERHAQQEQLTELAYSYERCAVLEEQSQALRAQANAVELTAAEVSATMILASPMLTDTTPSTLLAPTAYPPVLTHAAPSILLAHSTHTSSASLLSQSVQAHAALNLSKRNNAELSEQLSSLQRQMTTEQEKEELAYELRQAGKWCTAA